MVLFRHSKLLNNRNLSFLRLKSHNKNENTFQVKFMSSNTVENIHIELSNGSKITLSSGKYARFTSGCVTATLGDTSVMTTVVRKNEPCNDSVIPLTVNYRQKASAIGRIPTNFLRREIGYTDQEILISRIIDRSVRPLFQPEYCYETQIVCNLLATDGINNPDILSINAASAALSISDIPWMGPVAAVRVGLIDDTYIINPIKRDLQKSKLNLVLSSMSKNLIVMIEGSADDILEPELRKAIKIGVKECQLIIQSIKKLQNHVGKPKLQINKGSELNNDVEEFVKNFAEHEIREIFSCHSHDKISRDAAIFDLRDRMLESITNRGSDFIQNAVKAFNKISKENFRSLIFETDIRCDGRAINELRDIECRVDLFRPLHGSAFFQRGQTQVLCTVTLDSIESSLKLDNISMLSSGIKEKNFFLHYEFPPYAVNETGKLTGYDRREIGHGALAERGLRAVIPKDYPFAIRLTSEVLESNGSSSMASICGGSLALMDAGVPILSPVVGVAMGLICNPHAIELTDDDYKILTDISGIEDHLGDMDFKIAGTKKGFTALQADIKIAGVPLKVIMKAIENSNAAKSQILHIMNSVISTPASNKKENKPILDTIEVPIHQRGKFLGIGGSNIKRILCETGVNIHSLDDTVFSLFAPNQNAMNEAKEMIDSIIQKDVEPVLTFGDIYTAKITEIRETGVMVTLYSSMVPTLLPNSQLDQRKIHHPDVLGLNVGDEIKVKYFGRDPVNGRVRLSRKVLQGPIVFEKDFNIIKS
ncbi:polyribonucleotide nucleotidyltransferase 1, mitochondrial isoform X1 [Bombus huntii]|uniref:polyribonucleotide nucleotidyltransferase 1, mitochondrial isoform X1 n=2 Tax=Bombus huntii TaxID=85661 RepID=UPI0021AA678A|nr:polyribonucleotide nucleotidyltransferase 1, mitochondrial isoform X1 [Bombus huntii]